MEDDINNCVSQDHSKVSVYRLNIRNLNCSHGKLAIYLQLLKIKFDCICLSEIWNYKLDFYKNIFNDNVSFFKPPEDSNIGGGRIFIKKDYKFSEKNELKLRLKVEDLWLELTNSCNENFIVEVIYRYSKGSISDFTTSIENSVSKIIND